MTTAATTGQQKIDLCSICGERVLFHELWFVPPGSKGWKASKHLAACGRVCVGGGVEPADFQKAHSADCQSCR